jgi:hypothetical protein
MKASTCREICVLEDGVSLRLNEFEQIGIDPIRIRGRHAVRETLVDFQDRAFHQLGAQRARVGIGHDLVIIANS